MPSKTTTANEESDKELGKLALQMTMNRSRHLNTVLLVNDTSLISLKEDNPHVIHGNHSDEDAAVNLESAVLLNEEGIIQGCIKLKGKYYNPAPLKNPEKKDAYAEAAFCIVSLALALESTHDLNLRFPEPHTRVIYLADPAADLSTFYGEYKHCNTIRPIGFVIRCKPDMDKEVKVTDKNGADKLVSLRQHMESRPLLGKGVVSIGGKPKAVELRISRVKFNCYVKRHAPKSAELEVTSVLACFVDDPNEKWLLASSEGSDQLTLEDALKIVSYYGKRPNLFEYFDVLKSSVQMMSIRNDRDISDCLGELLFESMMAYRISQFIRMAKHYPDRDASLILTPAEFSALAPSLAFKDLNPRDVLSKDALDFAEKFRDVPDESLPQSFNITVRELLLLFGKAQGVTPTTDQDLPKFPLLWKSYYAVHFLGNLFYTNKQLAREGFDAG